MAVCFPKPKQFVDNWRDLGRVFIARGKCVSFLGNLPLTSHLICNVEQPNRRYRDAAEDPSAGSNRRAGRPRHLIHVRSTGTIKLLTMRFKEVVWAIRDPFDSEHNLKVPHAG